MATWKKVIVSGSSAELAALKVDNLTSGQVVIGGGTAGNLSTTAINGTGNIVATTNATGLVHSGSFSGSFIGLANSASFAATSSLPLLGIITASVSVSTITFTKGDGTTFPITVSQSGSAASANSVIISNTNTGIYYPTFVISGSSSQSLSVNSASFNYNAATNTLSTTASFATTASYILNAVSASYALNSTSASYALNATSASYALNATSASIATTASAMAITNVASTGSVYYITFAASASGVQPTLVNSSSFTYNAVTNVINVTSSFASSASIATSASYALNATTASFATTSVSSSFASSSVSASYTLNAVSASYVLNAVSSSVATSASYALNATTASFASTAASATQVANALTFGSGTSGSASTYNGSAAVTIAISGSATLTTNNHPKWTGTGFVNSAISDNGTLVTISTSASVSAGGINVTGNSIFNNNLTVQGDLAVNGTTTFINTTNTYIKDQFLMLYSGSNTLGDGGIIIQYSTGSGAGPIGSALFLESTNTSTYGRWAVAYDITGSQTAVATNEYVVTTIVSASTALPTSPIWGGSTNGHGNMYVNSSNGDIFIYS